MEENECAQANRICGRRIKLNGNGCRLCMHVGCAGANGLSLQPWSIFLGVLLWKETRFRLPDWAGWNWAWRVGCSLSNLFLKRKQWSSGYRVTWSPRVDLGRSLLQMTVAASRGRLLCCLFPFLFGQQVRGWWHLVLLFIGLGLLSQDAMHAPSLLRKCGSQVRMLAWFGFHVFFVHGIRVLSHCALLFVISFGQKKKMNFMLEDSSERVLLRLSVTFMTTAFPTHFSCDCTAVAAI